MDRERWQQVKHILEDAIEVPTEDRSEFVANACGDDPELRTEVNSLLSESIAAEALESNALEHLEPTEDKLINTQIGKYRLIELIGTGGMGRVYLAERADGAFEQKVALKLIRRGLDSKEIQRRFVTERQILASLEHPNIAHLIDGGTTNDGLPFLVMEYVEGTPLISYADANSLDLEPRLDLFREVCSAVSFAHQKLVIHRDLKPQNVLITNNGKAKLLDFGIAKLVKTEGTETRTQTFAFTPDYASPEQIRGENLSTATDIYSLGVILYELLTGSRPFRFEDKNIGEIIATSSNTTPAAPSIANQRSKVKDLRSLNADLDNIVLKALQKEPERRYASVEQFSDDISRYLKGQPVSARSDTWSYRAEKFARRNPWFVGTIILAFLFLIGGIATTAYQARKANIEREKAEARFNDVRTLANSFMFEINEEITRSPIKARELLVERALQYLDKLAAESDGDLDLKSELAAAYEKIGDVQSDIFRPFTGKTSDALLSHQKALTLRQEVFAANRSVENSMNVALSHQNIGNAQLTSGRLSEARDHYTQALETLKLASDLEPENLEVRRQVARSYSMVGQAIVRSGSLGDALSYYERSLGVFQSLRDAAPENIRYLRSYGIVLSYIAFVKKEMGNARDAIADYDTWLAIEKQLVAKEPDNVEFKHDLSSAHTWYGVALVEIGEIARAKESFEEAVKIQSGVLAADKDNLGELYSLADSRLEYGKAMVIKGFTSTAVENLEKALAAYLKVSETDKENQMTRHRIANSQRFLADAYVQTGDIARAIEHYEQAHAAFIELTRFDPINLDWQQDLAMTYTRRGEMALKKGDTASAVSNFQTALPIFETLAAASPDSVKRRAELDHIKGLLTKVSVN